MGINKRNDRVSTINELGEISVPIGHFALMDTTNLIDDACPKLVIYGLGSCIALILFDTKAKIYAMSHVLLPSYNNNKDKASLSPNYPQKYANFAVKDLLHEVITHGATKKNIAACIVGGAKIFINTYNNIGEENIKMVKQKLKEHHVPLTREVLGGTTGRNIQLNTRNGSIHVKKTGESNYKIILSKSEKL